MFKRRIVAAALVFVAACAALVSAGKVTADYEGSTPPLHLQGAAVSETAARFHWLAGSGNEWFCLDLAETSDDLSNLTGTWFNSGCGLTGTTHLVKGLVCSTTYFARVYASTEDGGMYSPELRVDTVECATTITPPTNMRTLFSTAHSVRLGWDAGDHNNWYCVEMAQEQSDLLGYGESWGSFGCGTTQTELTLGDLSCETVYYWRVVAWNYRVDTFSDVRTVVTGECGSRLRIAPILSVSVAKVDNGYRAEIVVDLPNACHSPGSYKVQRDGNKIEILVRNTYIIPLTVCADITGTHRWKIELGSDFVEGQTYEVSVNDEMSAFFTFEPPEDAY